MREACAVFFFLQLVNVCMITLDIILIVKSYLSCKLILCLYNEIMKL